VSGAAKNNCETSIEICYIPSRQRAPCSLKTYLESTPVARLGANSAVSRDAQQSALPPTSCAEGEYNSSAQNPLAPENQHVLHKPAQYAVAKQHVAQVDL